MNYFRRSFEKFKSDALSKVFYDSLKLVVITIIGFLLTSLVPKVNSFLQGVISFSIYHFLLYCLLLVLITLILVSFFYQRRYLRFKEETQVDDLTGLKNHKALEEYLKERIEYYSKNQSSFSLILIDIDDFKSFNTNYGFNTADQILGKVGELLGRDKRATDETFRKFSRGDEFVVVANDTNMANAVNAAERKRKLVANTSFNVNSIPYNLTVSCGVTEFIPKEDDLDSVTDRAGKALIEAKRIAGKNNTRSNI
ncbi:MAG: GGDEF domain-containing protein [Ekhidna sp.]|uniref:GGDEF domain-containing protein n=1 Tax=Ekhidna sp. TaxID=2608089 RepID=UPI003297D856